MFEKYYKKILVFVVAMLGAVELTNAFNTNQSAELVVGQPDMTTSTAGSSSQKLNMPCNPFVHDNRLYVVDHANNRVLIYHSIPTTNDQPANVVIGQINMNGNLENQGTGPTDATLYNPTDVWVGDNKLIIADFRNNRVLIYNPIPLVSGAGADVVIGQKDMYSNSQNQDGTTAANTLFWPKSVWSDGTKLFVSDSQNFRVLIYNNIPTTDNMSADVVIGQELMTSNNQGTSSTLIKAPSKVMTYNSKLILSDSVNNRILIYSSIPISNNAPANIVVGQVDMVSGNANQGAGSFNCTATSLCNPDGLWVEENSLYVADRGNNRVLIFNQLPQSNNASADNVLGQPDMISNDSNQGSNADAHTLFAVSGVCVKNSQLFASEAGNHRVLIYNDLFNMNFVSKSYATINNQTSHMLLGGNYIEPFNLRIFKDSEELVLSDITKVNSNVITCQVFTTNAVPGYYTIEVTAGTQIKQLANTVLLLNKSIPPIGWDMKKIYELGVSAVSGTLGSISVGDADNDGENELIVANRNLYLSKIDLLANGWQKTNLPIGGGGQNYISSIITDGDHNKSNDIYVGAIDNHLYRFEGGTWNRTDLGVAAFDLTTITFGDGNNDGWEKIYAASSQGELYQFKKTSSAFTWTQENMGVPSNGQNMTSIAWGDAADADLLFEIYAANSNGNIYQYKNSDSIWTIDTIATKTSSMIGVAVDNLLRSGNQKVYAANENGEVYQYEWSVSGWSESTIAKVAGRINTMTISDSDNNGFDDIIIGCQDGSVYKIEYDTQWTTTMIATTTSNIIDIAVGDGDNDYQHEIYILDENNDVFEINTQSQVLPTPTPFSTPQGFNGRIISENTTYAFPNPCTGGQAKFNIYTAESSKLTLKIYTTTNRFVHSMNIDSTQVGDNVLVWNYNNMANGAYIYLVKVRGHQSGITERIIKKIAIFK